MEKKSQRERTEAAFEVLTVALVWSWILLVATGTVAGMVTLFRVIAGR